jgi:serine/threonine protein kinase
VLSDFGLAKTNVTSKDVTDSFCGSPMYLSPEMLIRNTATHMSDTYGIGAVFYEMIHGHPLYEAEHIGDVFELIRTEKPQIDQSLP